MSEHDTQVWINKAALYEILALAFLYPKDELVAALVSGEYAEALEEILVVNALFDAGSTHVDPATVLRSAQDDISGSVRPAHTHVEPATAPDGFAQDDISAYTGRNPAAVLHELRAEHTRLFIGAPNPVVSPYAGVWYAEEVGVEPLLFVNKESMAVERIYRSIGVGQPQGTNEPLDHIATELEFLQYLCLIKAGATQTPEGITVPDDLYSDFYAKHFSTWVGKFAQKTLDNTTSPFFSTMARVLATLAKG